ncbi:MAG: imidazolonepropionase [Phycisphaerales bacterium]|nr:imidazolonepropionase [Planctomycetota bacterium]MCH8509542.1 imidazolonepropionase [Phycisphaerales bacterium]
MTEAPILIQNARVLTLADGSRPRRGRELAALAPIDRADVLIEAGQVAAIASSIQPPVGAREIDAAGRVLMPAFVDCHTHACWAGDRLDEWEMKQRGATYLQILESGGGIMSTVRAVRAASREQLAESLLARLNAMLTEGTTAAEVKSGYGLATDDELKMLGAIADAAARWPGRVRMTACIGHAKDPDADPGAFVDRTIRETLPAVHAAFPGCTIDAYCEQGAWTLEETIRLFEAAADLGHPLRVHADQFNELGMLDAAIGLGAASVDHLEATSPDALTRLAESETMGVMLPCSGFHVDGRYADGRRFVDAGGALAIATNCNPGSAPCHSMPMAIALAVRHLGLTAAEAIAASTVNAAALLGLHDAGSIEPGKRADLVLLRHTDERQLGYEFGGRHTDLVICDGRIAFDAGAGG